MKYDRIQIAIDNGAVMKLWKNPLGYSSEMTFKDGRSIKGSCNVDMVNTITLLNSALEKDAADQNASDNNQQTKI